MIISPCRFRHIFYLRVFAALAVKITGWPFITIWASISACRIAKIVCRRSAKLVGCPCFFSHAKTSQTDQDKNYSVEDFFHKPTKLRIWYPPAGPLRRGEQASEYTDGQIDKLFPPKADQPLAEKCLKYNLVFQKFLYYKVLFTCIIQRVIIRICAACLTTRARNFSSRTSNTSINCAKDCVSTASPTCHRHFT